ncbi:uncharacterized protein VP01_1389g3 [Puccinia sorghi]|uniref:Uncharacterized protein n=1 Tax=Puccinia sorghi TaxID=27349 RepID=A0A0L6VLT0_9BASI|nr:uncharacterized protein VP01_1389g3 [Puccinia sorghi]
MPRSSKRSECFRNLRKMLCLCVTQAAFEVQFNDSDNKSSSGTDSEEFRMSHQSFDSLLSLIQNHPVFYSNSNVPQQPVCNQLMVTLQQMGTSENGSAIGMLACFFRISEGAVILYCHRVVEAILALERSVGAPQVHQCPMFLGPTDYFSRKGLYGLATLVVCDRNKRITYYGSMETCPDLNSRMSG